MFAGIHETSSILKFDTEYLAKISIRSKRQRLASAPAFGFSQLIMLTSEVEFGGNTLTLKLRRRRGRRFATFTKIGLYFIWNISGKECNANRFY